MLVHFGIENIRAEWPGATVVMGTFDGVHLGHRALIARASEIARAHEEPCVIVTFDRHPASVLAPDRVPLALGTLEQNVIKMRESGASLCVILPFDANLSRTTAQRFFDEILIGALHAKRILVGHDFAFGLNRQGNAEWLRDRLETEVFPPFLVEGQRVSSGLIRTKVAEGSVEDATLLLGRPFALAGVVIPGHKRGRELGYPTANLARGSATVVPAEGVYAGSCRTPFGEFKAAISVGRNETFGEHHKTVEAYLLDYPGESLYGAAIEVRFHQRLRGQVKFDSVEALIAQMSADVEACR